MASQYSHGYTYDVFVSYSSRDAEWVGQFLRDLVSDTNRFADADVFSFLDKTRLQPGYVWDEALLSAAGDSAILLPILSRRFLQSDYCQKEVNTFLDAFGLKSNLLLHRSRILPVKLLSSAPKDHVLAAFQATVFCTVGADGIPIEFRPGSSEYSEGIRRLAYNIAQLLGSVQPKEQKRAGVYVATDFKPETDKLRASLGHAYDVLPRNPQALLSMAGPDLEQALSADFDRCFSSVHSLNAAPLAKPLIDAQMNAARTHRKPRMILATSSPATDLLNEGFEWLTSPSELERPTQTTLRKADGSKKRRKRAAHLLSLSGPAQQGRCGAIADGTRGKRDPRLPFAFEWAGRSSPANPCGGVG